MPRPNYDNLIAKHATLNGLPPSLLKRLMMQESGGNTNAVSKAGAQGLMQLMPGTASALGVSNPLDPEQNIAAGAKYLKQQIDHFGSVPLALAAYNAGPGAVQKYGGVPPYKETQAYVKNILGGSNTTMPTQSQSLAAPSSVQSIDPVSILQSLGLLDKTQPFTPRYNPFAATMVPNPGYNPAPSYNGTSTYADPLGMLTGSAPQPAIPGLPYDGRKMVQQPSLIDQRNTAEQGTLQAPTESEIKQKALLAHSKLLKSLADVVEATPPPQQEAVASPPFPVRTTPDMPTRPAPTLDPISASLSALAGIIDPQASGHYGTATLQGATDAANQVYADNMRRYQDALGKSQQQYEDQLAQRNDAIRQAHEASAVKYNNALNVQQNLQKIGELKAQSSGASDEAASLSDLLSRELAARSSGLQARQLDRTIEEQLAQNKADSTAYSSKLKAENDANLTNLGFITDFMKMNASNQNQAADRGLKAQEMNLWGNLQREGFQNKQDIAKMNIEGRLAAVKEKLAQAQKVGADPQLRMLAQNVLNTAKNANDAARQEGLAWDKAALSGSLTREMKAMDREEFIKKAVENFKAQAADALDKFENYKKGSQTPAGSGNSVAGNPSELTWNPTTKKWEK